MLVVVFLEGLQLCVGEAGEEGILQRVAVLYLEFVEHDLAGRAVLVVLHGECAVVELEEGVTLAQHRRDHAQEFCRW